MTMMCIIARKTLREYWERHPEAQQALQAWYMDVTHAHWKSPADIKSVYRNVSILPNSRLVFNIKGKQYRLIVRIEYNAEIVYIRFIGTHQEYDRIDASTV
jgi:mRNA interferase HigB